MEETALFSGKIYTADKNFTRPPVATVATNFKSGMVMVMLMVSFLLYISSTSPEHFPFSIGIQKVLILARPLSDFHFLHIIEKFERVILT